VSCVLLDLVTFLLCDTTLFIPHLISPPSFLLSDLAGSCFELLDACKFKEFWTIFKELEGNADLKAVVKPDQIRQGIVDVLALSYRAAPIEVVKIALNVDSVDASYTNVESVSATEVVFVATPDNTKRSRVFQEGVKFSAISSFVAASQ
jgi:hypothetical protein